MVSNFRVEEKHWQSGLHHQKDSRQLLALQLKLYAHPPEPEGSLAIAVGIPLTSRYPRMDPDGRSLAHPVLISDG
jgi:hypothetical protein